MALRFQTNYDFTDVPIPTATARQQPRTSGTVRRAKTLTRPERSVAPVPLITPPQIHLPSTSSSPHSPADDYPGSAAWRIASNVLTFWAPNVLLIKLGGLNDPQVRQAWREKVSLCIIIACLCAVVGFATVGFQRVLCPASGDSNERFLRVGEAPNTLAIEGILYNTTNVQPTGTNIDLQRLASDESGQDITFYFTRSRDSFPACSGITARIAADNPCPTTSPCPLPVLGNATYNRLGLRETKFEAGYSWEQVTNHTDFIVLDGAVINLAPYLSQHPSPIPTDKVDQAIRTILDASTAGKDGTRLFMSRKELQDALPCIKERYIAGNIDKVTPGCFVASIVLYAGLIVILGLVLIRFVMACIFCWFLSERLAGPPRKEDLNRAAISPAVLPEGANVSVDNKNGTAPWANPKKLSKAPKTPRPIPSAASSLTLLNNENLSTPIMSLAQIGAELFAVCLVTCYSEGEESLRTTLDSISTTDYSDARKLLFIVADGMITGAGEKQSTPDICVSLLEADPRFGNPTPMSYEAIGTGAKANNRAMIYAGHYTVAGRRTPTVIIVKCGTEQEALNEKKPGNRGKRDSQLILMNFFSRVTYNDRMCPLEFDLFRKIQVLMGVTPDFFEVVLMVDADTKVFPSSLGHLVNCMHHDQMIMGVCGETRIANKRQSWVTAIQVFEYFISHHLAKAFESVFGGVTCLPGCFSMFRLKARKTSGDDWVPLIIKPEIVKEYSQSEVITLHQKNLLLLGEDRFLTTILLRTFPNRKMMFLPQARCRTIVPDTFPILLSQRRRWINSTIHNLMELVLVRNLCGTFCFSMQFVVFMDLFGTVVLPIAIALTYTLIIGTALNAPKSFEEAIPLMLLISVLGLPAVLILLTTRKVVYVFWMLIYLLALPVWNFALPVYAFWHFDDFSWGETRKVEGEGKDTGHGDGAGSSVAVPLRRWEDWERSRLRKLRREERRRKDLERNYPGGLYTGNGDMPSRGSDYLMAPDARSAYGDTSDTLSLNSSDDDHWGNQIGAYNENNAQYPPPPAPLFTPPPAGALSNAKTVDANEMEAMLEQGWDDRSERATPPPHFPPSAHAAGGFAQQQQQQINRYQLSDSSPTPPPRNAGYAPLDRMGSPGVPVTPTALSPANSPAGLPNVRGNEPSWAQGQGRPPLAPQPQHGQQLRYGPLGPLDPSTKF